VLRVGACGVADSKNGKSRAKRLFQNRSIGVCLRRAARGFVRLAHRIYSGDTACSSSSPRSPGAAHPLSPGSETVSKRRIQIGVQPRQAEHVLTCDLNPHYAGIYRLLAVNLSDYVSTNADGYTRCGRESSNLAEPHSIGGMFGRVAR
jgi:hypothetical protein